MWDLGEKEESGMKSKVWGPKQPESAVIFTEMYTGSGGPGGGKEAETEFDSAHAHVPTYVASDWRLTLALRRELSC